MFPIPYIAGYGQELMNRIKGDVSTKAGCLAIADALTKAGVTKVYLYPLYPIVAIEGTDRNRWIPS